MYAHQTNVSGRGFEKKCFLVKNNFNFFDTFLFIFSSK